MQRCVCREWLCPRTHRPSVSEREPEGWIMNWMTDRLTAYQFRELESIEEFGERILWTNHFNERILEIQYSKKNCHSHHCNSIQLHYCLPWKNLTSSLISIALFLSCLLTVSSALSLNTTWHSGVRRRNCSLKQQENIDKEDCSSPPSPPTWKRTRSFLRPCVNSPVNREMFLNSKGMLFFLAKI